MAICYCDGGGVAQDYVEAVRLYKLAADQGYTSAEFNVGVSYAMGGGVEKDVAKATLWLERAAAKGHEKAKQVLSRLTRLLAGLCSP